MSDFWMGVLVGMLLQFVVSAVVRIVIVGIAVHRESNRPWKGTILDEFGSPKKTTKVFSHTLMTSKKDRDGDVFHSDDAIVDPKMPPLRQHINTLSERHRS